MFGRRFESAQLHNGYEAGILKKKFAEFQILCIFAIPLRKTASSFDEHRSYLPVMRMRGCEV